MRSVSRACARCSAFANGRRKTAPDAYIRFTSGLFPDDGEVAEVSTAIFLGEFMQELRAHIERVLTVIAPP